MHGEQQKLSADAFVQDHLQGFGEVSHGTSAALDDMIRNPDQYEDVSFPTVDSPTAAEHVIDALKAYGEL